MRRPLRLAAVLLLAACAAPPTLPPTVSLRAADAPLGSQTDVAAADLDGTWYVRRRAAGSSFAPPGALSFALRDDGLTLGYESDSCRPASLACPVIFGIALFAPQGQGRWTYADPALDFAFAGMPADFWVYWSDADRRTLALGGSDGSWAMILDRQTTGGADRIVAAREILDWYGFSVADLETVNG